MIEVRSMTLADVMSVVQRMRPLDIAGITATAGDIELEAFAVNRWQTDGPAWTVVDDGLPVAVGGLNFHTDWMSVAWFIATKDMHGQTWRKVVRHTRKVFARAIDPNFDLYRHRIEAHILADWPQARRFAESFGFVYEGTRRSAGQRGEDIQTWAITGPVKGAQWQTSSSSRTETT